MSRYASITIVVLTLACQTAMAAKELYSWDFSKGSDLQGWINAEVEKSSGFKNGLWRITTDDGLAKLESPLLDISAGPLQCVEVEYKTDGGGNSRLYYTNTTAEPYHGFRPGQGADYHVKPARQFQKSKIYPFWQGLGKVIRIRVDIPGKNIEVKSIRIAELESPSGGLSNRWDFTKGLHGWSILEGDGKLRQGKDGVVVSGKGFVRAASGIIDLDASRHPWAAIRASSPEDVTGSLIWATDKMSGFQWLPVRIRGGGRMRSYCLHMESVDSWQGRILMVGFVPSPHQSFKPVTLGYVGFGESPEVDPQIDVHLVAVKGGVARAGKAMTIQAFIRNTGGGVARDVSVRAVIDGKMALPERTIDELPYGEMMTVDWVVEAKESMKSISCTASLQGEGHSTNGNKLRILPPISPKNLNELTYVPAPEPPEKDTLVGCYYFPGWDVDVKWAVLDDYPERIPVLGRYREGDPEVSDWQTYWAASYGIDFFVVDWYWSKGVRFLEHWLHEGFLKSRHWEKMKFCLLWANHNSPKTTSEEDLLNVTRYWIDNYFKRPNYLKIGGKNVVVIFSTSQITSDLGMDEVRKAFPKMRKLCEDAGVGGLYLVANTYPGQKNIQEREYEGYDAFTGYNYPGAGMRGDYYAPYSWMVEGYSEFWRDIDNQATVPYIPVCEPGWDVRPWKGLMSNVRSDKNPRDWQRMLQNAKEFVHAKGYNRPPGDKPIVILEAWNELGEGDYIEPTAEWGFDYLEAVRNVFAPSSTKPNIVLPQDIGMGPYDIPVGEMRASWEFSAKECQNWGFGNTSEPDYTGGVLTTVAANADPALTSPLTKVDASKLKTIEIKMSVTAGNIAQIFFVSSKDTVRESKSLMFDIIPDGKFHVYTIDAAKHPLWKGTIRSFRFDPTNSESAVVKIEYFKVR